MTENLEKKRATLIDVAYFCLILAIYYVTFKYVIYTIWPFALAAVITLIISGPIKRISEKLRIPRKGVAAAMAILFYVVIGGLIVFLVVKLVLWATGYFTDLPALYRETLEPVIYKIIDGYEEFMYNLNPIFKSYIEPVADSLKGSLFDIITKLSTSMLGWTQKFVLSLPATSLGLLFTVVATFIMSMDTPAIVHFILAQFNESGKKVVENAKKFLGNGIGKVVTSYGKIMFITFVELCIGLTIIGARTPIAKAVAIAIFDVLPALGCGTVLIPWAVVRFIGGDWIYALKLAALWIVITIIRNIIEPKIVGKSIGISPVLVLLSMYVGVKIFGALGIIILPFTLIVVKNLNDSGYIHLFRSDYLEE